MATDTREKLENYINNAVNEGRYSVREREEDGEWVLTVGDLPQDVFMLNALPLSEQNVTLNEWLSQKTPDELKRDFVDIYQYELGDDLDYAVDEAYSQQFTFFDNFEYNEYEKYEYEDMEINSDGSLSFLIANSHLTYDCFDSCWKENPNSLDFFLYSLGIDRNILEKYKEDHNMKDYTILNVLEEAGFLHTQFISAVITPEKEVTLSGDFGEYCIKKIPVMKEDISDYLAEADLFLKENEDVSLDEMFKKIEKANREKTAEKE